MDILFVLILNNLCTRKELYQIYDLLLIKKITRRIWPQRLQSIYKRAQDFIGKNADTIKNVKEKYSVLHLPHLPKNLQEVIKPPLFIFSEGDTGLLNAKRKVAIVGTRNMTSYGRRVVNGLVCHLADSGVVLVTGGAFGIDGEVIRVALKHKLKVITVLGSGLANKSPQANLPLFNKQLATGHLIISEFPPNFQATKYSFPQRNRIISGLSQATVVIEAPQKSGALITADFAVEQNRHIFAVPGDIYSPYSKGCNRIIAMSQAEALYDFSQVTTYLGITSRYQKKASLPNARNNLSISDYLIQKSLAELA